LYIILKANKKNKRFFFIPSLFYIHTVQNNIDKNKNENKTSIQKEKDSFETT
jgi:hypothetical protein